MRKINKNKTPDNNPGVKTTKTNKKNIASYLEFLNLPGSTAIVTGFTASSIAATSSRLGGFWSTKKMILVDPITCKSDEAIQITRN